MSSYDDDIDYAAGAEALAAENERLRAENERLRAPAKGRTPEDDLALSAAVGKAQSPKELRGLLEDAGLYTWDE